MTLSTVTVRVSYAGDGSTTVFAVPFPFWDSSDLKVVEENPTDGAETLKTLTTHYTVTGGKNSFDQPGTGSLIMLVAPASGRNLHIIAEVPRTQLLDLSDNGALPAENLEGRLDRLASMINRLKDRVDRAVQVRDARAAAFDPTLPAVPTADAALVFNGTGTGLTNGPTVTAISGAAASAAAASASASAASGSASAASSSASAASSSASAASASAASAAAATASKLFSDVVYLTSASSPYAVTQADNGKLLSVNTAGGAVTINMPGIASLALPFQCAVKKSNASANNITINRNGTDTIDGATSKTISVQSAGAILVADTDASPDDWASIEMSPAVAATIIVQSNEANVDTAVTTLDYSTEFSVTSSPAGEANITLTTNGHQPSKIAMSATDRIVGRSSPGAGAGEEIQCTAAARSVLDDATVAAMRTTLGTYGRVTKQVFTASGTYTPTSGMLHCIIECVGGGGGGGGVAGSATVTLGAGGGGAGGYSRLVTTASAIGVSQTVTVGAAGAGASAGNNNGGAGGDTSVGTLCVGKGGSGGSGLSSASVAAGGAGGVAGTGDFASTGERGLPGVNTGGATAGHFPAGNGGSSPFGGGGAGAYTGGGTATTGGAASGFGAGGGGGLCNSSASNVGGGAGTAGLVIITEFLPQ